MNIRKLVMTTAAGLVLTATLPCEAQLLGGSISGAGNAVLGGGAMGGNGSLDGTLNSDLQDRMQAARERTQSAAESTAQKGHDSAVATSTAAKGQAQQMRAGAEQSAKRPVQASGSGAASTSVDKRFARRHVQADSNTSSDFAADRDGLDFAGDHASSASVKRDEPAADPAPQASPPAKTDAGADKR